MGANAQRHPRLVKLLIHTFEGLVCRNVLSDEPLVDDVHHLASEVDVEEGKHSMRHFSKLSRGKMQKGMLNYDLKKNVIS